MKFTAISECYAKPFLTQFLDYFVAYARSFFNCAKYKRNSQLPSLNLYVSVLVKPHSSHQISGLIPITYICLYNLVEFRFTNCTCIPLCILNISSGITVVGLLHYCFFWTHYSVNANKISFITVVHLRLPKVHRMAPN